MEKELNLNQLRAVSGGVKLKEADEDQLRCYIQLVKDMGGNIDDLLIQLRSDFENKIEYYDLFDVDGKPLTVEGLTECATDIWNSIS